VINLGKPVFGKTVELSSEPKFSNRTTVASAIKIIVFTVSKSYLQSWLLPRLRVCIPAFPILFISSLVLEVLTGMHLIRALLIPSVLHPARRFDLESI